MFPFRRDILEEHADEASFLARQRHAAFDSPTETFDALLFQDERLRAHLDGLAVGGKDSWNVVRGALTGDKPTQTFVAAWTAFAVDPDDDLERLSAALEDPQRWNALRWAARLAEPSAEQVTLGRLADSDRPAFQAMAAEARGLSGETVDDALAASWIVGDDRYARRVGVGAAMRRRTAPLREALAEMLRSPNLELDAETIAAGFACAIPEIVPCTKRWLASDAARPGHALALLAAAGGEEAAPLLVEATKSALLARDATLALGRLGHPRTLPVLVESTADPLKARAAGLSLERMLGVRLVDEGLVLPSDTVSAPEESVPEDDLELDLDEGLPVPDPAAVRAWWTQRAGQWGTGNRLRHGAPFTFAPVFNDASSMRLVDREAALLECFFRIPNLPFPEPRGWAHTQARSVPVFLQQAQAGAALALRATKGWPTAGAS